MAGPFGSSPHYGTNIDGSGKDTRLLVQQGSRDFTIPGALLTNAIMPGDLLEANGLVKMVDEVLTNTTGRFATPWNGGTITTPGAPYAVQRFLNHMDKQWTALKVSAMLDTLGQVPAGVEDAKASAAAASTSAGTATAGASQSAASAITAAASASTAVASRDQAVAARDVAAGYAATASQTAAGNAALKTLNLSDLADKREARRNLSVLSNGGVGFVDVPNPLALTGADEGKHFNLNAGRTGGNYLVLPPLSEIWPGWSCVVRAYGYTTGLGSARLFSHGNQLPIYLAGRAQVYADIPDFWLLGGNETYRVVFDQALGGWRLEVLQEPIAGAFQWWRGSYVASGNLGALPQNQWFVPGVVVADYVNNGANHQASTAYAYGMYAPVSGRYRFLARASLYTLNNYNPSLFSPVSGYCSVGDAVSVYSGLAYDYRTADSRAFAQLSISGKTWLDRYQILTPWLHVTGAPGSSVGVDTNSITFIAELISRE